jgi:hypothetical protein
LVPYVGRIIKPQHFTPHVTVEQHHAFACSLAAEAGSHLPISESVVTMMRWCGVRALRDRMSEGRRRRSLVIASANSPAPVIINYVGAGSVRPQLIVILAFAVL